MSNQFKWIFGVFSGLILIVFLAWQIIKNVKIEKYLQQTAQNELNKLWPESVHFSFESLRFKFLQKEVDLVGAEFQIFDPYTKDTLASFTLEKLSLKWLSYKNLLKRDTLKIQYINFVRLNSDFPVDWKKIKPKQQNDSSNKVDFKLQLDKVNFINSYLLFYDVKGAQKGSLSSKYEIKIENIYFDTRILPTVENSLLKSVDINFSEANYFLSDGFHEISTEKISLQPLKGAAAMTGLIFKPIHKWSEFAALMEVQKDHITLKADSIWFTGFQLPDSVALVGDEIGIRNAELYVHKDKNYEIPDDRFVPILIDKLEQAKFPVFVKKLIVENMFIDYKELPEGGKERGHIYLKQLDGVIENITNIEDSVHNLEEKTLKLFAKTKVFGAGILEVDIRYTLQSPSGQFEVKGSLSPMNLELANELVTPLSPMKIRHGHLDELEFYFSGNRSGSAGEMIFRYSDFKVDVNTNEDKKFKDDILTLFANIAVPEFNPKPNGKLRIGEISMPVRDTKRSMFKFWVDNLMSGFKSTAGINEAAEIEENENENNGKGFWGKLKLRSKKPN